MGRMSLTTASISLSLSSC
uniref:Uncharacterized protein n=1 Tax=Arundo donax TaxID=35708 RepID=A0A0A9BZB7_ARUDO